MTLSFGGWTRGGRTKAGWLALPVLALVLSGAAADALAQHFSDRDTLAPVFPTPETEVEQRLPIAQDRPGAKVFVLGCGAGRIVIAAAQKYKARAVGIEIRRDVYERTLAT